MSDYLLVPTNVQSFLVGKPADPTTDPLYDLVPVPRTADDLASWYRNRKFSFSFQRSKLGSVLKPGIHLHWALPDALMHARHEGSKAPEQPCIPNRWLVLRMWHTEGNSKISSKVWVVESDYISDDANSGGTPFIFVSPSVELKYVGRTVELKYVDGTLQGWKETNPAYRFELKSFGWGDPSFAAYYPASRGVLGFHDAIDDKVAAGNLLTYLVVGWYSDPARDPLHPPTWQSNHDYMAGEIVMPTTPNGHQYRVTKAGTSGFSEPSWPVKGMVTNGTVDFAEHDLLASLGWSCSGLKDAAQPLQTLCHGGVVGIKWQGPDEKYAAASVADTRTVAIGSSAAEALAALLAPDRQKDKSLQQVLCAFHHGQATQVSDYYQLGELLHRHSFNAATGGTHWSIEPIARSAEAQTTPPPVSQNVQKLLIELNNAQQALDQHAREVESLRWRLFACWATWASKQTGPLPRWPSRNVVNPADDLLKKATNALPKYEQGVEVCKKNLTNALTGEKTGMQIAESTMPPFLHPKDPFVVLKGENLIGIDRTHAQKSREKSDGALPCRLVKDVVTSVSQSGTVSHTWQAGDCFHLTGLADVGGLPHGDIARTLALETLLFDANSAASLDIGDAKLLDRDLFKALQESLDKSRKSNSNTNTLTWIGEPPDPLGITRWGESNPWLPVYLIWQAHWAPGYAPAQGSDNSHSKALEGWQLDSDPLAGDLVAQAGLIPKSDSPLLEGATIISAVSGSQLAENLAEFAKASGYNAGTLEGIKYGQVLGQSLGGFNELLLRQTLGLCLPLVDPTTKTVDASIWGSMGGAPQPVMPFTGTFLPVRVGALKLVNLYIVGAFGQTRKLIDSSNSMARKPDVIASATLPPPPADYHASFSPRLIQPARLNFDWQPADTDAASGPICGWIVPNFLEKSFAIFTAGGEPLGALESLLPALGEKTIGVKFNWRPIPGSALAISGIVNERLRRLVDLVSNFSAAERHAFLELIDLVLRKTAGRVPPEDPAMAVLLGRPLAVVYASLALELNGLPAGYWKTDGVWKFETEGFEKLRIPARLGGMSLPADGLVGYLLENGEPCLFASEGATRRPGNSSRIKYDQQLTLACTDKPPLSLTLLMDASARVHTTTGILPRHFIELPREASKQVGLIEEVYFNVAPVLGARPQEAAAQPAMPRPSDAFGQWSWATRPALSWHEIRPADDRARFADGLALSEGWLKLRLRRDKGDAPQGNQT